MTIYPMIIFFRFVILFCQNNPKTPEKTLTWLAYYKRNLNSAGNPPGAVAQW